MEGLMGEGGWFDQGMWRGFDGGRLREVEDGEWKLYDDCK